MTAVSTEGATTFVGRYIADSPSTANSVEDLATAKRSLIDTAFAFSVSAAQNPTSPFLGLNRDDVNGVTLCGVRLPATPVTAALAFGATARSLELDDWASYGAASGPIFGTLLNLARLEDISDEPLLLDAWCIGVRVGVALWTTGRYRQADRGFDGTDIFGSIACAAAGARLLKLDAAKSSAAVAIAGSEMGGLVANLGTDVGILHAGFAARNGFQAALLARAGIYGATDVLEARQGFGEAIFGPADGPLFNLAGLLESRTPLAESVRLKRFPSAIEHQRVIATVQSLAATGSLAMTDIGSIRVEGVPPTSEGTRFDVPMTGEEARRSLRYVLARLLLNGSISLSDFSDASTAGDDVADALNRVEVNILQRWDARLLQDSPAEASEVSITTTSGSVHTGDPTEASWSLDDNALISKWEQIVNDEHSRKSPWAQQTFVKWQSSKGGTNGFSILGAILAT